MYSRDDIGLIDMYSYIRHNPKRFFRSGAYDATEMSGRLVAEALYCGSGDVHASMNDQWCTVAADQDWLANLGLEPFEKIIPIPGGGPNSMFSEVLAVAFALSVVTARGDEVIQIKGDAGPVGGIKKSYGRVVAFSVATDPGYIVQ
jgi:hypothetical protein